MTRLTIDGPPQTGDWRCRLCGGRWDWFVDARSHACWLWSRERTAAFRARARRYWHHATT